MGVAACTDSREPFNGVWIWSAREQLGLPDWTDKPAPRGESGGPNSNGAGTVVERRRRIGPSNWRRSVDRTQKEQLVASLRRLFEETTLVVVTHYSGLTVLEMGDLRDRMREAEAGFKVTKNRLTRLALVGTKFQDLSELFIGPTGIAYSADPVAAAKAAVGFAKANDKLLILGGAIGENKLDSDGIMALAALPSLDQSRAKLVGLLNAPATRVAGVLQAPAGQLARVLNARAEQDQAA